MDLLAKHRVRENLDFLSVHVLAKNQGIVAEGVSILLDDYVTYDSIVYKYLICS